MFNYRICQNKIEFYFVNLTQGVLRLFKFKNDQLLITQPPHFCLLKVIILYIKGEHVPTGTSNQNMSCDIYIYIYISSLKNVCYHKNVMERGPLGYPPSYVGCGVQLGCARDLDGDSLR